MKTKPQEAYENEEYDEPIEDEFVEPEIQESQEDLVAENMETNRKRYRGKLGESIDDKNVNDIDVQDQAINRKRSQAVVGVNPHSQRAAQLSGAKVKSQMSHKSPGYSTT